MAPATPKDQQDTPTLVLPVAEKDPNLVEVTITKLGDGRVSTGEHVTGEGDIFAKRHEKLMVSKATAARLEILGLAEAD